MDVSKLDSNEVDALLDDLIERRCALRVAAETERCAKVAADSRHEGAREPEGIAYNAACIEIERKIRGGN